ncbi:MAG: hypothetical protein F9B45_19380 [Phycisphaera sp. RhM]|nr:hypothetical protein [Phycisphaera sp. RhM]
MRKYFFTSICILCLIPAVGCGGSGDTAIIAPSETEASSDVPVEGMSEEEYAKAMQQSAS